jgi:hypothetical protein
LIDGRFEQIFAVRDLASHRQILWLPVDSTNAAEACALLTDLFSHHGPPLVMKSDQGSAFIGQEMTGLLEHWRVFPLLSPKATPQYNGALERANSTHKTYTHQQAVREAHPTYWTSKNLEAARRLANTVARPWGHAGPSADEAWQRRMQVTPAERDLLQAELERQRPQACVDLGIDTSGELTAIQRDRVERRALSAALERLGYLTKTPTRRPPRTRRRSVALQRVLKQQREAARRDVSEDEPASSGIDFSLASADPIGKMRAVVAGASPTSPAQPNESAHREPTIFKSWRKLIAPVIKLFAAAKNSR